MSAEKDKRPGTSGCSGQHDGAVSTDDSKAAEEAAEGQADEEGSEAKEDSPAPPDEAVEKKPGASG